MYKCRTAAFPVMLVFLMGLVFSASFVRAEPEELTFTAADIAGDTGISHGAVMGDVDRDGDLDVYVANGDNQQNKLWLNGGSGSFTAADIAGDTGNSYGAVIGDVDRDGDPDIYVANDAGQNNLWLNDGTGVFTAADIAGDTGNSHGTVMGDVDEDGDLDIYVANDAGQNKLWLNDGSGTFTAADIAGDTGNSYGAVMGDVDRDGDLDIYVANDAGQNKLWLNGSSGTFTAADITGDTGNSRGAAIADVDEDGDPDIYVANDSAQNKLWLNDGTGSFTASDITGDLGASSGAVMSDVDRDGDPDIYVANDDEQNKLWLNDGSGSFTAADIPGDTGTSSSAVMGDIDGDGYPDIYAANAGEQQNNVWLNDSVASIGVFISGHRDAERLDSCDAVMGDVDGDGDLDIYVANIHYSYDHWHNVPVSHNGQNSLWLNDGSGSLTAADIPDDTGDSLKALMGDVDGDGDLDIYVANYMTYGVSQNKLWLNDSSGTFTAADIPGDTGYSHSAVMGDVDRDGDLDIYVVNSSLGSYDGQNRLWLNDGSGSFTAADIPGDTDSSIGVSMGDVDRDGDLDIYVANSAIISDGQNRLWLNDGSGSFTAADITGDTGYSYRPAMGDVDRDGDLDIFVLGDGFDGNHNRLWQNDGSGSFTAFGMSGDTYRENYASATAMGDVDHDGDLDIYMPNSEEQLQSILWLNDGSGSFAMTGIRGDHVISLGAVMGDVDGDGDLDIYTANQNRNRIWFNTPGPVLATNTGLTVYEGETGTITSSHLLVTDLEQGPDELGYIIGTPVANGILKINTTAPSVSYDFFQDDIDNGRIAYEHDGTATTSDSFTFTAYDGTGGTMEITSFFVTVLPPTTPPVADAGEDQESPPAVFTLDGTGSYDPDEDPITYLWEQIGGSVAVTLSGTTTEQPSFTARGHGDYTFRLTVTDTFNATDNDQVTVTVLNVPPDARPGRDRSLVRDTAPDMDVVLDGSASIDANRTVNDDDIESYQWEQVIEPGDLTTAGVTLEIDQQTPELAVFDTSELPAGIYQFRLTVTDGGEDAAAPGTDTVTVTVNVPGDNIPPTAHAGVNIDQYVNTVVTLSGHESKDTDGDPLTYLWRQVANGAPTLPLIGGTDYTSVQPKFRPVLPGAYIFELIVNDGTVDSLPDTVEVYMLKPADEFPIADILVAGVRTSVVPLPMAVGDTLVFDGEVLGVADPGTVTGRWSQTGGPAYPLEDETLFDQPFTPVNEGVYTFRLDVFKGTMQGRYADITVTVVSAASNPPTAEAGDNQTVLVDTLVTLDGSAEDADIDPVDLQNDPSLLDYTWTQVLGPNVPLSDSAALAPTFTPRRTGVYCFQLVAFDGTFESAPDQVHITVNSGDQIVPEARVERDHIETMVGNVVVMNGIPSFDDDVNDGDSDDPEDDPDWNLIFQWEKVAGPPAVLDDLNSPMPTFIPSTVGLYTFKLYVDDRGDDLSMGKTVTVNVGNVGAGGGTGAREAGGGPGVSCFIATAAYGTPFSDDVATLRRFRDRFLLPTEPGRKLVGLYYRYSPPVADAIRQDEDVRKLVRTVLAPAVRAIELITK